MEAAVFERYCVGDVAGGRDPVVRWVPRSPEGRIRHEADTACCVRDAGAGARVEWPGIGRNFARQLPGTCQLELCRYTGGRAAELQSAFEEAAERGVPVGAVLSEFSRLHGGSIEGCFQ